MANARQEWICGSCGENYGKESYAEECCHTECEMCGHSLIGFCLLPPNCSNLDCLATYCSCISKTDN